MSEPGPHIYRGTMEIEQNGIMINQIDELDDDMNYIKSENRSLRDHKEPGQQSRSLYFLYVLLLMAILGAMYMTYDLDPKLIEQSDQQIVYSYATNTLFGCDRNEFYDPITQDCQECQSDCDLCTELAGECVRCSFNEPITWDGICESECQYTNHGQLCVEQDVHGQSGIFRSSKNIEIPYLIIKGSGVLKYVIYIFQDELYRGTEQYLGQVDNAAIVIIDDYYLLSNRDITTMISEEMMTYIEKKQLRNTELKRIVLAQGDKSNQLLYFLINLKIQISLGVLVSPINYESTKHYKSSKFDVIENPIKDYLISGYNHKIFVITDKNEELIDDLKEICTSSRLLSEEEKVQENSVEEENKDTNTNKPDTTTNKGLWYCHRGSTIDVLKQSVMFYEQS